MQQIGTRARVGFVLDDLDHAQQWFEGRGAKCMLVDLRQYLPDDESCEGDAHILLVRKGLAKLMEVGTMDDFYKEQDVLEKDKKALMRGSVKNKRARWNLCFGPESQEPDYEQGRGRIVAYEDVPLLNEVRTRLEDVMGPKGANLVVEGNYYYDPSTCYIGYHGDTERRRVIGVRVGQKMPLYFNWFKRFKPVGRPLRIQMGHGDIYIMSEKAVGSDWKKSSILTLRHAAGAITSPSK
jgi:hypothetical protein